jgi:hypothetical protein
MSAPLVLAPVASATASTARRPDPRPVDRLPTVQFEPSWRFQVGGQVDRTAAGQTWYGDSAVFHRQVPVELVWHAASVHRTPALTYDLFHITFETKQVLDDSTATSYRMLHTDQARPIAPHPGRLTDVLNPRFSLVATARSGGSTTVGTQRHPVFSEQENGTTYLTGRSVFPAAPTAGRAWTSRSGDAYDAGAVLTTRQRGATVRIPVTTHADQWVALEMTTGPQLGAVEVRVDGHRVGVVDTYRATTTPRVLVAQYRLDAGNHTVTLVNLGVHHRATVELDGVFASD